MKVGDYVRTKYRISKITNLETYCNLVVETNWGDIDKDKILKSSPNIIDLIEVGDIITFGYVYTQTKEVKNIKVHRIKNEADLTLQKFYFNYKKRVLKSIVTKEQFSQMEYRLEEK